MKVKCLLAVLLLSATAAAFAQRVRSLESSLPSSRKEAVTMGQKVQGVQYFDDYGRKEASELTNREWGGVANVEKHIRTIADGDMIISIDLDMKGG
ncbi:MAG: hypothetical protein ACLUVG_01820 [Phocaeicola vulgatus]